ncbi:MAG: hypothetical protein L0196_09860 [candidate division Zixibacteria bacterium]|nr:hypothetical protein [candidate division Zixibacteria bacterium]
MRRFRLGLFGAFFLWGCGGPPFLIAGFERDYKPKIKTIAVLPFSISAEDRLVEQQRMTWEEGVARAISQSDSSHSFVFPERVRARFLGATDSSIFGMPAESLGVLFSAEALLFTKVIRLFESEGSNPTSRQVGASKFQRRGIELLMEFRLVEAATEKLLWKYRVRRFGDNVQTAARLVGQAAAGAWPLRS